MAFVFLSFLPFGPSLQEFKGTFQQTDFRLIYYSMAGAGDLNRVWCAAVVLAFDPRLSGGPRWQGVKVKGKGDGDGVWEACDGCEGSPSGRAEPRQFQTSIWVETVLRVISLGAPRSYPVCSHSPLWPRRGTETAYVSNAVGWWFPS